MSRIRCKKNSLLPSSRFSVFLEMLSLRAIINTNKYFFQGSFLQIIRVFKIKFIYTSTGVFLSYKSGHKNTPGSVSIGECKQRENG